MWRSFVTLVSRCRFKLKHPDCTLSTLLPAHRDRRLIGPLPANHRAHNCCSLRLQSGRSHSTEEKNV